MIDVEPISSRVLANGIDHHVLVWDGLGETFVFCHGFLDLAYSFDPIAKHLVAAGHRVVAFDWRGHGESAWVGAGGYYHFADYLLDLDELLPKIASGPVHLVGHSMGGTASAMYGGARPAALRTLSLLEGLGPPMRAASETRDRFVAFLDSVRRIRQTAPRPIASVEEAYKRMRTQNPELPTELGLFLAEKSTRALPDGTRMWRFDPLHRSTAPVPFQLEAFEGFLARIAVPTLLIFGGRGFRLADEEQRVAHIADARSVVLPDAGHMMHWSHPEKLASLLSAFVRDPRTPLA